MTTTVAPPLPVEGERAGKRLPPLRTSLTAAAVVVIVVLLVLQRAQLVGAVAALRHLKWWWVGLALGLEATSMAAVARLQRRMLRATGTRIPLTSALGITYAGNAISVSLPLAGPEVGTLFAYRQFQRRGATQVTAAWVVLVSGVISSLAFTVVVIGGALASTSPAAATAGLVGGLTSVLALLVGILAVRVNAVFCFLDRLAVRVLTLVQRVVRRPAGDPRELVTLARDEVSLLHLRKSSWATVVMFALINWLADAGCLAAAVKAAGLPLPGRSIVLIWSAGAVTTTLNLTPGGLGVVEAALIAGLVAVGLPTAGSTTAVLTYRLVSFWLVLAVGWMAYPVVQRRGARARGAPVEEPAAASTLSTG
ncbi:MAG: putative heme transporter [Frankiales bacterium]|nr:putative heme transporter [Frankiales bacterium]MDX6246268.1 putative heme transporter [Frankiales bacterium]